MYLLDTNILSAALQGLQPAADWLNGKERSELFLSVLTLGEIRRGAIMKERIDRRAANALHAWLGHVSIDYAPNTLPVTSRVSMEWGRISALRSRGYADSLIAATAIVHGFVLVTRNVRDFNDLDVPLINPWEPAA